MDSTIYRTLGTLIEERNSFRKEGVNNELGGRGLNITGIRFIKTTWLITLAAITTRWLSTTQYWCIEYFPELLIQFDLLMYMYWGFSQVISIKQLYGAQNILMFSFYSGKSFYSHKTVFWSIESRQSVFFWISEARTIQVLQYNLIQLFGLF